MERIVECVPNVSDGQNPEVYNAIAKSCEKVPGVRLLDVDPGFATNRTVITFAGPPEKMVDAAFEVIKASFELIDMQNQKGEHPRMGATDVCPFVPVSGVSMEECVKLAKALGERVGEELNLNAYLYENAASKSEWRSLPNVRKGEYEGLKSREGKAEWKPDFGPDSFNPKFGAVAIGARKFLVAYNINLNTMNKKIANDMAMNIRESGRVKRVSYPDGKFDRDANGEKQIQPGLFKHCKAGAWVIPEYGRAQITMNLTDIDETPLHHVFDEVYKQSYDNGIHLTGSEIVGLVPLQVMIDAGKHYLKKQKMSLAVSEEEIVSTAIFSLGLNDITPFVPEEKIIEYKFKRTGLLVDLNIKDFINTTASDQPAPGGGSIAALSGALSSALTAMVTNLTFGNKKYPKSWESMEEVGVKAQSLKKFFVDAIDRDTDSFNDVIAAIRLPKETEKELKAREIAMEKANQNCLSVPLEVLVKTAELIPLIHKVTKLGNTNCASDTGVAYQSLLTCAEGAALNVKINMASINDQEFKDRSIKVCNETLDLIRLEVAKGAKDIEKLIEELNTK